MPVTAACVLLLLLLLDKIKAASSVSTSSAALPHLLLHGDKRPTLALTFTPRPPLPPTAVCRQLQRAPPVKQQRLEQAHIGNSAAQDEDGEGLRAGGVEEVACQCGQHQLLGVCEGGGWGGEGLGRAMWGVGGVRGWVRLTPAEAPMTNTVATLPDTGMKEAARAYSVGNVGAIRAPSKPLPTHCICTEGIASIATAHPTQPQNTIHNMRVGLNSMATPMAAKRPSARQPQNTAVMYWPAPSSTPSRWCAYTSTYAPYDTSAPT